MSKINPEYYTKHTRTITINGEKHDVAPIDLIDRMPYPLGAMLKYLIRYKDKNGKEDLEKAMWYLMHCIKQDVFYNASGSYRQALFKLFRQECPILLPLLSEDFIDKDILEKFKPTLADLIKNYKEPEKKEDTNYNKLKKNLDELNDNLKDAPIVDILYRFNGKLSKFFNCFRIFLAQNGAKAQSILNDSESEKLKQVLQEFIDLTKETFDKVKDDVDKLALLSASVASKVVQSGDIPQQQLEDLVNTTAASLDTYQDIVEMLNDSNIIETLDSSVELNEENIKKKGLPPEISLKELTYEFSKVHPNKILPALLDELNEKVFNGTLQYDTFTKDE